jgi:hypothetical protein
MIADALFDGTTHRARLDFRRCHRPVGPVAECDALEDLPGARAIDKTIRLAPRAVAITCHVVES